jgi:hypothetical protein
MKGEAQVWKKKGGRREDAENRYKQQDSSTTKEIGKRKEEQISRMAYEQHKGY